VTQLCRDCIIEKRTDCALVEVNEDPTTKRCWELAPIGDTAEDDIEAQSLPKIRDELGARRIDEPELVYDTHIAPDGSVLQIPTTRVYTEDVPDAEADAVHAEHSAQAFAYPDLSEIDTSAWVNMAEVAELVGEPELSYKVGQSIHDALNDGIVQLRERMAAQQRLEDRIGYAAARPVRQVDLRLVEGKSYEEVKEMTRRNQITYEDRRAEELQDSLARATWASFKEGAAVGAALTLGLGIAWAAIDRVWSR
jgi:hypothetical protein